MPAAMEVEGRPEAAKCLDASRGDPSGFHQPDQLPAGELLWPIRDEQRPEVVHTVEEFLDALLFQPHVDRVVVLPNGVELLNQQHAIPEKLCRAVRKSSTIRSFLAEISKEGKDEYRARLWHYSIPGMEKEIKTGEKSKLMVDKIAGLAQQEADGVVLPNAPIYVSELRNAEKHWHPLVKDEFVKTSTMCDVYDFTPDSRKMPLWERSEGGIFLGERGTGSGFHIDQCMWSNVGRNWCGHKLFAIWPWADRFTVTEKVGKGRMLHLPLTDPDVELLGQAKCIALVKPGDVWVFSGAQPHTALVVGDALNISAYESLVPANAEAVFTLIRSNIKDMHPKNFWMDDEDLDELFEDVVDNIQRALKAPSLEQKIKERLQECTTVMRERGDAYCRELWRQEDCGERQRRREQDSSSSESEEGEGDGTAEGEGDNPSKLAKAVKKTSGNFSDALAASVACVDDDGPTSKKARNGAE